jgi:hypothetical protein
MEHGAGTGRTVIGDRLRLRLAASTKARTESAGTFGLTAIRMAAEATIVIGAKSFSVS